MPIDVEKMASSRIFLMRSRKSRRPRRWLFLACLVFLAVRIQDFVMTNVRFYQLPSWIRDAGVSLRAAENVTRCPVEDMGCFMLSQSATHVGGDDEISAERCFEACFKRGLSYAGLVKNKKCFCGKNVDKLARLRKCDVACSADKAKNCAVPDSVRIFRLTRDCRTGISNKTLERERIGCIPIPMAINESMLPLAMENFTQQQCLLNCENRGFQLALPIPHFEACLCSDVFSMFASAEELHNASRSCPLNDMNKLTTGPRLFPLYRTSTLSNGCKPRRFLPQQKGPLTVITSFWGSGNTWLRHLLELSTGIYTGSIYMDEYTYNGGMIGEKLPPKLGRTLIIKDHMVDPRITRYTYASAILIIRNLYDATLAEYARLRANFDHVAVLDPKSYYSSDFQEFVEPLPDKWTSHVERVFHYVPSVIVVF